MNYIRQITAALFIAASVHSVAWAKEGELTGYDLKNPDKISFLPDTLHEISGLTNLDSATFACVQDENGIIFIYDEKNNSLIRQFKFNIDGDYEGITRVDETIYILRSDGTLFEIINFTSDNFKLNSYNTGIPSDNNEGLCYDSEGKRLLIACKGKIGKGPEFKDKRVIYSFDLHTRKLSDEPVFDFNLNDIKEFAKKNKINVPEKSMKRKGKHISEPVIRFNTSAICIHPLSKRLFVLSASDHMIFVFDMNGNIEHMEYLNPGMFNKSEGISFYSNGDMLITNEGQNKRPTVLYFKYIGK